MIDNGVLATFPTQIVSIRWAIGFGRIPWIPVRPKLLRSARVAEAASGPRRWCRNANHQCGRYSIYRQNSVLVALSSVALQSRGHTPQATVTNINIDNDPVVSGLFSSAHSLPSFRLAIADFANLQGLTHVVIPFFRNPRNPVKLSLVALGAVASKRFCRVPLSF